jgi:hypothetical protein
MAGIQAALVFGLRIPEERHIDWPMTLMAALSAALLAAGVLRHYWDIWVHRTVRGISFLFVGIDAAGDVFSLLSIFFQSTLDIQGVVIYATEFALWCGIFACGAYYNLLPWARKKWLAPELADQPDGGDEAAPDSDGRGVGSIMLHETHSSTSVFQTVSAEAEGLRPRVMASLQRSSEPGVEPLA